MHHSCRSRHHVVATALPGLTRHAHVHDRERPPENRPHAGISSVTPDDEHEARGPAIRNARAAGLEAAGNRGLTYHRRHRLPAPPTRDPTMLANRSGICDRSDVTPSQRPGSLGGVRKSKVDRPTRPVLIKGLPPVQAAMAGSAVVGLITAAVLLLGDGVGHATKGLLLILPVAATAVLGGRRAAQFVAALATLMFTLVLPPVGSLRIRFAEDLVALIVFSAVALTISGLVAHRIEVLGHRDEQRAALLRSVSHDLRTPLSTIRAAVSELEDASLYDAPSRARLLSHVGEEAERLDRLVSNLLSLARVEGGGFQPRRQAVDLVELVALCTTRLERVLQGIDVQLESRPDLPMLLADHTLLDQVVTNLLENAARHSPPGGRLDVAVQSIPGSLRLIVADQGPGVRPEDAKVIFEPFRSGDHAAGSGIGLATCKAVVEAHGGTITVGGPPGGGAVFTVTLPVA